MLRTTLFVRIVLHVCGTAVTLERRPTRHLVPFGATISACTELKACATTNQNDKQRATEGQGSRQGTDKRRDNKRKTKARKGKDHQTTTMKQERKMDSAKQTVPYGGTQQLPSSHIIPAYGHTIAAPTTNIGGVGIISFFARVDTLKCIVT